MFVDGVLGKIRGGVLGSIGGWGGGGGGVLWLGGGSGCDAGFGDRLGGGRFIWLGGGIRGEVNRKVWRCQGGTCKGKGAQEKGP